MTEDPPDQAAKTKKCRDRALELPECDFPKVTVKGKVYFQPRCPECHRRYAREHYQREKERISEIRKARRKGEELTANMLLRRTQAAREREARGDFKKCSRCERLGRGAMQPKSAFARNRHSTDGRQSWSMRCTNEDVAENYQSRRERQCSYLITRSGCDAAECPVEGAERGTTGRPMENCLKVRLSVSPGKVSWKRSWTVTLPPWCARFRRIRRCAKSLSMPGRSEFSPVQSRDRLRTARVGRGLRSCALMVRLV